MPKFIDKTGTRFGKLVVLERSEPYQPRCKWKCICDCGKECEVSSSSLRPGGTTSCGCNIGIVARAFHGTHGKSKTREYKVWASMKDRCSNPNVKNYHLYGGRGIKVCQQWIDSFECFMSDMGPRPEGATIERRDGNGDYCPENCKWADRFEQNSNTSRNHYITFQGETLCVSAWARKLGITHSALAGRISRGWVFEKAMSMQRVEHRVRRPS